MDNPRILISIVIPFYKRFAAFERTLGVNTFLFRKDLEVIMCLDDASDEDAALAFAHHNDIQSLVIVNDKQHEWRSPARAINVGIRHAIGHRIAIFSPETCVLLPSEDYLFLTSATSMIAAIAWNVDIPRWISGTSLLPILREHIQVCHPVNFGYGFILFDRLAAQSIYGWNEAFLQYGGEDAEFRFRMLKHGLPLCIDPHINVIHLWHTDTIRALPEEHLKSSAIASAHPIEQQKDTWGKDFDRIAFNWRTAQ